MSSQVDSLTDIFHAALLIPSFTLLQNKVLALVHTHISMHADLTAPKPRGALFLANELAHVKYLDEFLVHSKHSLN